MPFPNRERKTIQKTKQTLSTKITKTLKKKPKPKPKPKPRHTKAPQTSQEKNSKSAKA